MNSVRISGPRFLQGQVFLCSYVFNFFGAIQHDGMFREFQIAENHAIGVNFRVF